MSWVRNDGTAGDAGLSVPAPLGVAMAGAAFCRLFGGDVPSMGIVFAATIGGFGVKQWMTERRAGARVTCVTAAFVSTVAAAAGHLFGWGATPEVAVGCSVLYLIPGIPYLNAAGDLLGGRYRRALRRMGDCVALTACLSLGLCCGLLAMGIDLF